MCACYSLTLVFSLCLQSQGKKRGDRRGQGDHGIGQDRTTTEDDVSNT